MTQNYRINEFLHTTGEQIAKCGIPQIRRAGLSLSMYGSGENVRLISEAIASFRGQPVEEVVEATLRNTGVDLKEEEIKDLTHRIVNSGHE